MIKIDVDTLLKIINEKKLELAKESKVNKIYYSYQDFSVQIATLVRKMHLATYKPDVIVGVVRGGLVPAAYLSHYFDVPLVTAAISFRDGKVVEEYQCFPRITEMLLAGQKVLMVDDICDSGHTLRVIWDEVDKLLMDHSSSSKRHPSIENNLHTAVLVYNEAEIKFFPDFEGVTINKEEDSSWIVFDWENW